jgi:hypothetical protein
MATPGTAAAMASGEVIGWGLNNIGQVNIPAGLSGVTAIAAGTFHSLALKSDGEVIGWGRSVEGQLDIPAGLSGVTAIAAGSHYSLALKNLSVPQQITQIITQVQDMVNAGSLSSGQGAGLITKLNAFINQVNGFINAGALSQEQGQTLIDEANNIKANIGC